VQHGEAVVEKAVAEAVAGVDHCAPRLPAHHAVGSEAAGTLKCLDRSKGAIAEFAFGIVADREVQLDEPVLDVPDRLS